LFLSAVDFSDVRSGALRVTDTSFHHVAVTKSGSTVKFYVDGVEETAPAYDPGFSFTTDVAIGNRGDLLGPTFIQDTFTGVIDEVEIFARALSAPEIQAIFSAGSAGKCKPEATTPTPTPTPTATPHPGTLVFADDLSTFIVQPDTAQDVVVQIRNTGNAPHTLTALSTISDFQIPAVSFSTDAPFTVGPGETVPVILHIDPTGAVEGTYLGLLKLASDGMPGEDFATLKIIVRSTLLPDLTTISSAGTILVSPTTPDAHEPFTIFTTVYNVGTADAGKFTVNYFAGTTLLGSQVFSTGLSSGGHVPASLTVDEGLDEGFHVIRVEIVPPATGEVSVDNNAEGTFLQVGHPTVADADISTTASASVVCDSRIAYVAGQAQYVIGSGLTLFTFPVQGGRVTATLFQDGQRVATFSGEHTSTSGFFFQAIGVPAPGAYDLQVEVTDFTLSGTTQIPFVMPSVCPTPPPTPTPAPTATPGPTATPTPTPTVTPTLPSADLYLFSEDILFLDSDCEGSLALDPDPGATVCIRAIIHYYGTTPLLNQPVTFAAHVPVGDHLVAIQIGSALVSFSGSGAKAVDRFWVPAANGAHIIHVQVHPTISQFTGNDAATRAIHIGQPVCQLHISPNTQTVAPGQTADYTLSATALTTATPSVDLTIQGAPPGGLPPGVTAVITPPSPLTLPFTATVTINTANTTPFGNYALFATAAGDGCSAVKAFSLVVINFPPTVYHPVVYPEPSDEGSFVIARAAFSDWDADGPFTCTVAYDSSGAPMPARIVDHTCIGSEHTYLDDGSYTVTVSVTDEDGATGTNSTTHVVNNVPPVVGPITASPEPSDEGSPVAFSAVFTDPGVLDTHTIAWDFGDGTTASGTLTPAHAYADNGVYTVTLAVTDNGGEVGNSTLAVSVANVAPTVHAGPDRIVDEGSDVCMIGYFTDPGALDTHTIVWDFGDGATASGTLNPVHIYADDGVYTVTLTVTDDDGDPGSDTRTVTVYNVPPLVDAGPDQAANEGEAVAFAGSFDDPGTLDTHSIAWDFGDGTTDTGVLAPTHIYADDGVYTVTLTVADDDEGMDSDTLVVTVHNVAPSVDAGPDQATNEGEVVYFGGNFSDPGVLDTHTITWDLGDGTAASGTLNPTHIYADEGVYTVTLTVRDDDGGVGRDTLAVTVGGVIPVVDAGPDRTVDEGESVLFAGSFVMPVTRKVSAIEWDFGDGGTASGTLTPTHTYADDAPGGGAYAVSLTVTDDKGRAGSDTLLVTVRNVAPSVNAGPDRTVDEGTMVYMVGSFTDPGTLDTHTISWDFGDGGTADGTLMPVHAYGDDGVYTVTLTVADDDGGVGSDTRTVTVHNVAPTVSAWVTPTIASPRQVVTFTGVFTDPGWLDTHTIVWDFGDGVVLTDDLHVTHIYALGNVYTATLTVTDDDGGTGQAVVVLGVCCELYPIALHVDTLAGVEIGQVMTDVYNGGGSGNFGWLSWTGDSSVPALVHSLTPPGDSATYINPYNSGDRALSLGDWVYGKPGVSNASSVRNALDILKNYVVTMPVWDTASGSGSDLKYHVAGFARVQITDYHLPGQNRISAIFWGSTTCPNP
jgi:PKD repeat protein